MGQDIYYTPIPQTWNISQSDANPTKKYNLYDLNLDSQWECTGADAANKALWIDRGTTPFSGSYPSVDAVVFTLYSGSYVDWSACRADLYQHVRQDDVGKIDGIASVWSSYMNDASSLFLREIPADMDYRLRFINIGFVTMPADPILTQIMLLKKHTTGRNPSIDKSYTYYKKYSTASPLKAPKRIYHSYYRRLVKIHRCHYPLRGAAEIQTALDIFKDCQGQEGFFIYQPGTLISDMILCRMLKAEYKPKDIQHQHQEITYEFEEIYKISSGYST